MHIVKILPDELLSGYRGRIAALNNNHTAARLHAQLRAAFPADVFAGQSPFVANLANALQTQVRTLLDEHTLWPLFAAFPNDVSKSEAYDPSHSSVWLKSARKSLACCDSCIREDLHEIGFSYWRRAHQLPGQFCCPKHGAALSFITPAGDLLLRPDELQRAAARADETLVETCSNHQVARRTLDILQALLLRVKTVSRAQAVKVLQRSALQHTGAASIRDAIPILSTEIHHALPLAWLSELMPNVDAKRSAFVALALGHPPLQLSAAGVACVAAYLLDTSEAALNVLMAS